MAMSGWQAVVVSLTVLLSVGQARNCHFCGDDVVSQEEVQQYCRDYSYLSTINLPKTADTYQELLDMFKGWGDMYKGTGVAVTHSRVMEVYQRNRTTGCLVETPGSDTLEMGEHYKPCRLITPWYVVTLENICILKELERSVMHIDEMGRPMNMTFKMTLISNCPYNVSKGDEVIVNLESVRPLNKQNSDWASVRPDTDTMAFKAKKLVWATPGVLDQMVKICGFQSPRSMNWPAKCPKVPADVTTETCDNAATHVHKSLAWLIISAFMSLSILY